MPRSSSSEYTLIQILPEILSHQAEGRQERPTKRIEVSVPVVGIATKTLENNYFKSVWQIL